MHKAENQGELADAAAKMIATSHDNVIKAVGKLEGEIRRLEGEIQSKHRWVIGLIIGVIGLTMGVVSLIGRDRSDVRGCLADSFADILNLQTTPASAGNLLHEANLPVGGFCSMTV